MFKMKKNTVSVVVPVFNVENYLEQCVESVLNQTYKDIQLILIDDGSTDKSGEICDEYVKKDDRCLCTHKPNGGISSARNIGIGLAEGEYICFVDSDDYIDKDFIASLVNSIDDYDVVACGTKTINASHTLIKTSRSLDLIYRGNEKIRMAYMNGDIKNQFYSPCAKLYKASIIKNNIIFDTELKVAEDIVFNLNYLAKCASVKTINFNGYNIRENLTSTTHRIALKYTPLYEHDYLVIQDKIADARRQWGFDEEYLTLSWERGCPMRYYYEVTNLFRPETPYDVNVKLQKIKVINSDKKFIYAILKQPFGKLTPMAKLSWISAFLRLPLISYFIFYSVLKFRKEI